MSFYNSYIDISFILSPIQSLGKLDYPQLLCRILREILQASLKNKKRLVKEFGACLVETHYCCVCVNIFLGQKSS